MLSKLEIAQNLRVFIEQILGLSLKEFSYKSGISEQTLQDYLPSEKNPDKKISYLGVEKLSKLIEFKCNINWLLTRMGEPLLSDNLLVKENSEKPYTADLLELKKQIEELKNTSELQKKRINDLESTTELQKDHTMRLLQENQEYKKKIDSIHDMIKDKIDTISDLELKNYFLSVLNIQTDFFIQSKVEARDIK